MSYDPKQLFKKTNAELNALFSSGAPEPIPNGEADGTVILAPDTIFTPELATLIQLFIWKGKVFDAAHRTIVNRIGPFGLNAIVAQVYPGPSLFDHKPCIILDYSKTTVFEKWARDEIRRIDPHTYFGKTYWDGEAVLHFLLRFDVKDAVV